MKTPGTDGLVDSINYSFLKMYFWLHWVFTDAHGLSLVVVSRGYSLILVHGLLIVVASILPEHRF